MKLGTKTEFFTISDNVGVGRTKGRIIVTKAEIQMQESADMVILSPKMEKLGLLCKTCFNTQVRISQNGWYSN